MDVTTTIAMMTYIARLAASRATLTMPRIE